jgi:hypothetical protein
MVTTQATYLTYSNIEPTYCNVHHYFHNATFVRYALVKHESSNGNNGPGVGRGRASVNLAGKRLDRIGWVVLWLSM